MNFKQILKTINNFTTWEEFRSYTNSLKRYDNGSSRVVFKYRDTKFGSTVIKFDVDDGYQNQREIELYTSKLRRSKFICPILNYDKESFLYKKYGTSTWIQMPFARKVAYSNYYKFTKSSQLERFQKKYNITGLDLHEYNIRHYNDRLVFVDYGCFKTI